MGWELGGGRGGRGVRGGRGQWRGEGKSITVPFFITQLPDGVVGMSVIPGFLVSVLRRECVESGLEGQGDQ